MGCGASKTTAGGGVQPAKKKTPAEKEKAKRAKESKAEPSDTNVDSAKKPRAKPNGGRGGGAAAGGKRKVEPEPEPRRPDSPLSDNIHVRRKQLADRAKRDKLAQQLEREREFSYQPVINAKSKRLVETAQPKAAPAVRPLEAYARQFAKEEGAEAFRIYAEKMRLVLNQEATRLVDGADNDTLPLALVKQAQTRLLTEFKRYYRLSTGIAETSPAWQAQAQRIFDTLATARSRASGTRSAKGRSASPPADRAAARGLGNTAPAGSGAGADSGNGSRRDASPARGKADSSPPKRDSSPAKRDSSPAKADSSPPKRDSSPAKRDSSPAKRDSSPAKRDSSPAKRDSSAASTPAKRDSGSVDAPKAASKGNSSGQKTPRDASPTRDKPKASRDASPRRA